MLSVSNRKAKMPDQLYEVDIPVTDRPFGQDAAGWASILNDYAQKGEPVKQTYRKTYRHRSCVVGHIVSARAEGDKVVAKFKPTPVGLKRIRESEVWNGMPRPVTN